MLQEYNATINYCFYSKQALYLVVFNLRDGDHGVKELDSLLKNIKVVIRIFLCVYICTMIRI